MSEGSAVSSQLQETTKQFAFHGLGSEHGTSLYANSPLPKDLRENFPRLLSRPSEWKAFSVFPYLTQTDCIKCNSQTIKQIADYLTQRGWHKVAMYQLEWNSFIITNEGGKGRVYFACRSTAEYSGVPKDIEGYKGDDIVLESYPSQWGFSVPESQVDSVRNHLLNYGWHEGK